MLLPTMSGCSREVCDFIRKIGLNPNITKCVMIRMACDEMVTITAETYAEAGALNGAAEILITEYSLVKKDDVNSDAPTIL